MNSQSQFGAGRSVWIFACLVSQMRALLLLGAPVDLSDQLDPDWPALTPLASSILRCDTDAVELLLAHGADPTLRVGDFLAFELCEPEALSYFGMTESTHPQCQIETRELLRPARERFLLQGFIPGTSQAQGHDPRRL